MHPLILSFFLLSLSFATLETSRIRRRIRNDPPENEDTDNQELSNIISFPSLAHLTSPSSSPLEGQIPPHDPFGQFDHSGLITQEPSFATEEDDFSISSYADNQLDNAFIWGDDASSEDMQEKRISEELHDFLQEQPILSNVPGPHADRSDSLDDGVLLASSSDESFLA